MATIPEVVPTPPRNQKTKTTCQPDQTPWWKTLFEVIAVLVGLGLLAANYYQAIATQQAAETATKTFKLTFRSRLVITGMGPDGLDNGRLRATFRVPNYGPTPAKNARYYRFESVTPWNQTKRLPYGEPLSIYPQLLMPNDPNGMGMSGERIVSDVEIKGLIRHDLVATFSVLIVYEDELGITHHAEYCEQSTWLQSAWNQPCWWLVQND